MTMCAHYLHWSIPTCLLSKELFADQANYSTTLKMVPMEGSKLVVENWYCCHCQYDYICLFGTCLAQWVLVDFMATLNFAIHVVQLFFPAFAIPHPNLCSFHLPPYLCWPKINAFLKISSKSTKIYVCICQVVMQKLVNKVIFC